MADKFELFEEELENISGGQITYTWNGERGTLGINGNNPYILVDKEGFLAYYNSVKETMPETQILRNLCAQGIIKKP